MLNINIKKAEFWFVLCLPVINALTPILVPRETSDLGFHAGYVRNLLMLFFCVYFLFKRYSLNRVNIFVLIFIIYMFLLLLLNPGSNLIRNIQYYILTVITFFMLPVGYHYFKTEQDIRRLNLSFFISAGIISMYLAYANVYSIGYSNYLEDSFYTGNINVNIAKILSIIIITTPIMLSLEKKYKTLVIIIAVVSLIFILLALKRSALLAGFVAVIIYMILAPRKVFVFKILFYASIALFVLSSFFLHTFLTRWEARQESIETSLNVRTAYAERQDRMGEFLDVIEIVGNRGPKTVLFGEAFFETVGAIDTRRASRPLHVDYSVFLYTTGIVGLFFFLFIYLVAHFEKKRYSNFLGKDYFSKELNAVFYAIIGSALIMSIAGSWGDVGLRTFIFLYLGAIIGVTREKAKSNWGKHNL